MSLVWAVVSLLVCLLLATTNGQQLGDFLKSSGNNSIVLSVPLYGDAALASVVPNGTDALFVSVRSDLEGRDDQLWLDDVHFGGPVFQCGGALESFLELDGFEGMISPSSFATSFWFRVAGGSDEAGASGGGRGGGAQTLMVVPTGNGTHIWVWVDAEGDLCVGDGCTEGLGLNDGDWHHVTLSTPTESSERVGEAPAPTTTTTTISVFLGGVAVSSGEMVVSLVDNDPASSSLLVCASAYQDELLAGNVAGLTVFDRGLNATEVVLNYNLRDNPFTGSAPTARSAALASAALPVCSDVPIPGVITYTSCATDHVCYKVHERSLSMIDPTLTLNEYGGRVGLCAPKGIVDRLPDPRSVPPALAFFPLTINRLLSYPQGIYGGDGRDVVLVEDELFGQALYCDGEDSFVALDTVPYGVGGRFSINLWFKDEGAGGGGRGDREHSWLFSHGAYGGGLDPLGADQVQIYLTNDGVDGVGVGDVGDVGDYAHVTAVVFDRSDARSMNDGVDAVPVLHGNGQVGEFVDLDDGASGGLGGLGGSGELDPRNVRDGDWHMVTVTTNGDAGFVLYLDGEEVNSIGANSTVENVLGEVFDVHGGDMLLAMNEMVLCRRGVPSSDDEPFAFRGRLAYLSLWDTRLGPGQVRLLFDAVKNAQRSLPSALPPSVAAEFDPNIHFDRLDRASRVSVKGARCMFPAIYAGALADDCVVYADGTERCEVADEDGGGWQVCAAADAVGPSTDSQQQQQEEEEEEDVDDDLRAAVLQRGEAGGEMDHCLLSEPARDVKRESPIGCRDGLMCVPITDDDLYYSSSDVGAGASAGGDDLGTCMRAPSTISRFDIFNSLYRMNMAQPLSLYPLIDRSLEEVTLPPKTATAENVQWRWSSSFKGEVPQCTVGSEDLGDASSIELVISTTQGPEFSECVWFSLREREDPSASPQVYDKLVFMRNDVFEAVLHPVACRDTPCTADQYTLDVDIVAAGDDADVMDASTAATIDSAQRWHMACASVSVSADDDTARNMTSVDLYLDGTRIKTLAVPATVPASSSGLPDAVGLRSNVTLCPSFDGRVTNYVRFGSSLSAEDINTLFRLYEDVGIADFGDFGQTDDTGLSAGAIAGIVIISLLCGGLLAVVSVMIYRKSRSRGEFLRRDKDSNVAMPDDDADDADAAAGTTGAGAGERSLREQFSYEYSASDLSGQSLSRQFSYEYTQEGQGDHDHDHDHGRDGREAAETTTGVVARANPIYEVEPRVQ